MSAPRERGGPLGDPEDIRRQLVVRLERALAARPECELVRADVLVEGVDALDWLGAQPPGARGYWADRESEFELAGVGRADMVAASDATDANDDAALMAELHRRIDNAAGRVRYFGGLRFDPTGPCGSEWAPFRRFRFVLPRFELVRRAGVATLSCNLRRDEGMHAVDGELAALAWPGDGPPAPSPGRPLQRRDRPDPTQWDIAIARALDRIRSDAYRKIVLARRATLQFKAPPRSDWFLRRLRTCATRSFLFCFQPDASHAFLGASPERLYCREDRLLRTEAIAGTCPRHADPDRDRAAGQELLSREKDRREHRYVVDGIGEALDAVAEDWRCDPEPELLRLTHAQHLATRFRGVLRDGITDGDLLRALHPTPAVEGYPRLAAMADIAQFEQFDRGYFAAPVGWVEREAAQFAVGIRSGLIEGSRLHLYSGAGVVEGSDPAEEWQEIENKIADFLEILPTGGVSSVGRGVSTAGGGNP